MQIDAKKITEALRLWFQPGDVFEIRVLDAVTRAYFRPHIESGYFDYDHIDLVPQEISHITKAKGCYVTVNPVKNELLNRAVNRVRPAGREPTSCDSDILCRRWLLVDCDAKRVSGIPSSDAEHTLAAEKAEEIRSGLASMGWSEPIVTDSGNGAQLMYRIDLPTDDDRLLENVLKSIAPASNDAAISSLVAPSSFASSSSVGSLPRENSSFSRIMDVRIPSSFKGLLTFSIPSSRRNRRISPVIIGTA